MSNRSSSQAVGEGASRLFDLNVDKVLEHWGVAEGIREVIANGFDDVETLHALVESPSQPGRRGTEFVLNGVSDAEIETAKGYFLRFSGDEELERTEYGSVLVRAKGRPGSIYVKGLRVATEDAF